MKRLVACFFLIGIVFLKLGVSVTAQTPTPPIICGCPAALNSNIYTNSNRPDGGGACVSDMVSFQQNPTKNHLWVEDPEITAQGKADERARQFLFWVFRSGTIDNDASLIRVWSIARNVAFFAILIVAAVMGLGIVIGQRTNFSSTVKIWPQIMRLALLMIYVAFSSTVVIVLIQLSDVMMKFFVETLGGKDLLNINFGVLSGEENYVRFVGCRDLNLRVQEGAQTQMVMLKITNLTYYVMGIMLILRKVLLWFLLFVSPFLALLLPFVFIRNVGWIWIGVFFQWLFYGPLFALFLGGLTTVWRFGIPFIFDFSRVSQDPSKCDSTGYVYPTAINILYGGPAQKLAVCNNGNYVDTFAEYIISLIMLWAVIFFPWWLLRIFRDYCCDGIMSMKNILLSMYDQMRGGSPFEPGPAPTSPSTNFGTALKMPKDIESPLKIKLDTVEQIKKTKTTDITRNLNLSVSNLTDIARFETNNEVKQNFQKNLNFLQNPTRAETPTERQRFMNIRSELFSRAIKEDKSAKQILSSISTSKIEQIQKREELIKSISQVPVASVVSLKVNVPEAKIKSVSSSVLSNVVQNNQVVNNIAQKTNLQTSQVQQVLASYAQNTNQTSIKQENMNKIINSVAQQTGVRKETVAQVINSVAQNISQSTNTISERVSQQTGIERNQVTTIVKSIAQNTSLPANANQPAEVIHEKVAQQTGIQKEKVKQVAEVFSQTVKENKQMVKQIAKEQNLKEEEVAQIIDDQIPAGPKVQKPIEKTISIPPSISIDEYEQVKKMWKDQYQRGEVPVSDNIKSRNQWVEQDSVFITNILNKLVSTVPEIRQQGLDEIGYILPIFLLNNLKGDQLVVYLKAKLEAAKEVQEVLEQKEEAKAEIKAQEEEELVEVEKPKAQEAEKTMKMSEEIKEEKPPQDNSQNN